MANPTIRKVAFTDKLTTPMAELETGFYLYYGLKEPGLCLRASAGGARAFAVRYRTKGRERYWTIGKVADWKVGAARTEASRIKELVRSGHDPIEETRADRAAPTVGDLCDHYLAELPKKVRASTATDQRNAIEFDVRKRLGRKKIAEISIADITRLHSEISGRDAPRRANAIVAILRRMFVTANRLGWTTTNPTIGVEKNKEVSSERCLTGAEIVAVWKAADAIGPPFGPITQLLILTGQRKMEVAGMHRAEIDLAKKEWRLPSARTKNAREHLVPLSTEVLAIITTLPHREGADLIFTTTGKTVVSGFSRAKRNLDKIAGIPDWKLHDLRRSVASGMASIGIQLHVIEKTLNHVSGSFGGIVGIYQKHQFDKEKRTALEAWGRHVMRLVSGEADQPTAEIVEIGKRRK